MNKFKELIQYANDNHINFGVIYGQMELCPYTEFKLDFIDTETFEIPNCFMAENCLIMCFETPDVNSSDYSDKYALYYRCTQELIAIERPSYVAFENEYTKIFCWNYLKIPPKFKTPTLDEFISYCKKVVAEVRKDSTYHGEPMDFRCTKSSEPNRAPYICGNVDSDQELTKMFNWLEDCNGINDYWDCELFLNYTDDVITRYSENADAGIIKEPGAPMILYY